MENVCIDNRLTHIERCEGSERLLELFIYSPAAFIQVRSSPTALRTHSSPLKTSASLSLSLWVSEHWKLSRGSHLNIQYTESGVCDGAEHRGTGLGKALISGRVRLEVLFRAVTSTVCLPPPLFDVFIATLPEDLANWPPQDASNTNTLTQTGTEWSGEEVSDWKNTGSARLHFLVAWTIVTQSSTRGLCEYTNTYTPDLARLRSASLCQAPSRK